MDEPFVCIGHNCSYTSTNPERSSSKLTFKIFPFKVLASSPFSLILALEVYFPDLFVTAAMMLSSRQVMIGANSSYIFLYTFHSDSLNHLTVERQLCAFFLLIRWSFLQRNVLLSRVSAENVFCLQFLQKMSSV